VARMGTPFAACSGDGRLFGRRSKSTEAAAEDLPDAEDPDILVGFGPSWSGAFIWVGLSILWAFIGMARRVFRSLATLFRAARSLHHMET
jgi:hypothetical protein